MMGTNDDRENRFAEAIEAECGETLTPHGIKAIARAVMAVADEEQAELRAELAPDLRKEERWVPITETGARWVGRSKAEATKDMAEWPAGSTYSDGAFGDGIVEIVRETRWVSDWAEDPA
jgi:hypothetical protein